MVVVPKGRAASHPSLRLGKSDANEGFSTAPYGCSYASYSVLIAFDRALRHGQNPQEIISGPALALSM